MTFTPNTRADIGEGDATGQSEPMVAVDEFGQAYLSWASGKGPYGLSRTTDGVHFTYLGTPNSPLSSGDVILTTSSWPSATETRTPQPGVSGVIWSALGSGCAAIEIVSSTSTDFGATYNPTNAGCVPGQVDRPWVAAYTDPQVPGHPRRDGAHVGLPVLPHIHPRGVRVRDPQL